MVAIVQRELVDKKQWLTAAEFVEDWAVAQVMPGSNVLFVALMGWNVGLNTGSVWAGLFDVVIAMTGIILPSATLTYSFANWSHKNREKIVARSFKLGMAPIVIGLLIATGWIMANAHQVGKQNWPIWLLAGATAIIVWRTRLHLLWLLAAGALLGWFGLI